MSAGTIRARLLLALVLSLGMACATTPEAPPERSDAPAPQVVAEEETPEVPVEQSPRFQREQAKAEATDQGETRPASALRDEEPPAPAEPPKPAVDPSARAAFERGVAASRSGDFATAEQELKAALQHDPKLVYAHLNLGVVYERAGRPGDAERAYEAALDLEPDHGTAWDYHTRLRCRTGRASDVEAKLRTRIQQNPAAIGPRSALVYALVYQRKHDSAAAEAKKVLKADERNVRAMQLLAHVYYTEKKYELVKMVLENARAIDTGDAVTFNMLGLVHLALKAKPQALESFKQAVALQPDYAEANNNFGAMLNEAQDYEAAVAVLEAAVRAAPEFAAARMNLGNAYRGKQDLARAIAEYQQVLELRPDWVDTYYNLAILHLDSEVQGLETIPRLEKSISYFAQYQRRGGRDDRVEQYVKDAQKGIEKEKRAQERKEKDKLRKAQKEIEDKKRAEEEKLQAEAAAKAEAEARARAEAEVQAKAAAEAEKQRLADEKKAQAEAAAAEKQRLAEEKKAKAEAAAAEKKRLAEEKKAKAEAEAAEKKRIAEEKKKAAAAPAVVPASKLGEEDEPEATPVTPAAGSGKLGEDEK